MGKDGPWRTDYYSRVSAPVSDEVQTDIQAMPARSDASPEKAPSFLSGG